MIEAFLTAPEKGNVGRACRFSTAAGVPLSSISGERNARGDDLCDLSPDAYVSCDLRAATWCPNVANIRYTERILNHWGK